MKKQEPSSTGPTDSGPKKELPKRTSELLDQLFFPPQRLMNLAALAANVQGTRIDQAKAPKAVITAIRELNEVALLAAGIRSGVDGAERLFGKRLASSGRQKRSGTSDQRSKSILAGLDGLRGMSGLCNDSLSMAAEVLEAGFSLDVRNAFSADMRNKVTEPTQTYQAASYMQGRMRTVAQFESELWREVGGGGLALGQLGGDLTGSGGKVDPWGGSEGPSQLILPPEVSFPDPPPDPGGLGTTYPGLCEQLAELCIALYEEAAAALLGDPYIDLIASVELFPSGEPPCLSHDYDPAQVFIARPAQGRRFPVDLIPGQVRLIFRGTDITGNIIHPVTPLELRFTIPPNSETGSVYLRGFFRAERMGIPNPERLCGMSMPHFPAAPVQGPAALISIIFPPVIDSLTANGDLGPSVVVQACRAIPVCWHVHLANQAPHLPLPPCARIEVIVRNEAGDVVHEGVQEGCVSVAGEEDQTLTVEARSFANDHECGSVTTQITLERVERVTLIRDVPPVEELVAGTNGNFFVEISCPAPAAGVQVRLRSTVPSALQLPANVMIPDGQTRIPVNFNTGAEARGRVDLRAAASGHEEGWLAFNLVPSAAEVCQSFENLSDPWSRQGEPWANWGIVDSAETFLGFLPSQRMFRVTNQYEIAQAIRRAEADQKTIRALGSGWSFSEAVLPQSSPIADDDGWVAASLAPLALSGFVNEQTAHIWAANFKSYFGYAIDTSLMDRSLQVLLPDVLRDDKDPATFFFVEAGMTINFLNTLLDSQEERVALQTMGGVSGQTIAGAISTGTHGGDFDRPPLADAVRAIYLIGAGGVHHWIEPASPITDPSKLRAAFPCLGDNIHYDEDMFRAALVSLGGMGVIYALILDVVPQYSLLQWNKWSTWETLKAEAGPGLATLFDGTWTGMHDFLELNTEDPPPNRFVQVVVNPIRNEDGTHPCYVNNRVQLPLQAVRSGVTPMEDFSGITSDEMEDAITSSPEFGLGVGINFNFHAPSATGDQLKDMENLLFFCKDWNYPWAVRAVIDLIMRKSYPEPGNPPNPQIDVGYKVMAPGGTSRTFPVLGSASVDAAFSFLPFVEDPDPPHLRVVVPDAISFIDSVLIAFDQGVNSNSKVFPAGWLSLRVTGRTTASLGMQRFNPTGMVEVSLIGRPEGHRLVKLVERMALEQGGALHWGQSNGMIDFISLESTYGNARIDNWKAAQRALGGDTFTNLFMRRCGLAP